ncbi:MAG: ABC transporter substrate-binding protein [Actinomycetota bacterium]|nr:ABC transporter substrate-binding protein [Actinomycetota bacterium]
MTKKIMPHYRDREGTMHLTPIRKRYLAGGGAAAMAMLLLVGTLGGGAIAGANTKKGKVHFHGTVHIAGVASLTGSYAFLGGPILGGTKAAAYLINKAGGILGKKLVIDPVDTKGDPADAATALQQEIALNHPVALIGPTTLEIHGVEPIFTRFHIPDGWQGGTPAFVHNKNPWLWRCNPSDTQQTVAMAGYAVQKKYKTAALLFTSAPAVQSFEPLIRNAYTKLGGKIVTSEVVAPGLSTYSSEARALVAKHPQVIFTQMTPPSAAVFFKNLESQNLLNTPFIGSTAMATTTITSAIGASVSEAHMVSVEGSTALSGAGKLFAAAYKKVTGNSVQSGANFAYDCTVAFALAMDKAKSTSGPKWNRDVIAVSNAPGIKVTTYAAGLADIKRGKKINYTGVSGPLTFNKFHNVNGPWSVVRVTGKSTGAVTVLETISVKQIVKYLQGKTKL